MSGRNAYVVPVTSPGHTNTVGALRHCADLLEEIEQQPDAITESECLRRVEYGVGTLTGVQRVLMATAFGAPDDGGRQ